MVQALRLNTMSKFTFADCTRFDALIKDVFPGIDFKEVEYSELSAALRQVFEEANYEIIPNQVTSGVFYHRLILINNPYQSSFNLFFIFQL